MKTYDFRALALRATREFFWEHAYREIDTPLLSPFLIPEATLEVFSSTHYSHSGRPRELYLIPSPELWMKRLLAQGSGNLFQLAKCFRNREPPTGAHHPEFTMLEWYTEDADYLDSLLLQEEFFDYLRRRLGLAPRVRLGGRTIDLAPPFLRLPLREAFAELGGIDLDALQGIEALAERALALGLTRSPGDTWESLYHKIFLTAVEPRLPRDRPFFLLDYPASLPTLARIRPDGLYAERWELYAAGLEIANCYTEERNRERVARFFSEEAAKKAAGPRPHRVDEELAKIIAADLPPCSGNALGFDRLLMALLGKDDIREVIPFARAGEGATGSP